MKNIAKQLYALIEKDIVAQLRTKDMLMSMFIFVLLTFIVLSFGFFDVLQSQAIKNHKAVLSSLGGLLWIAYAFAAILGLNRTFVHEKDEGVMDGLLLAPLDRTMIYWGKAISNFIFIITIQVLSLPIFTIFFVTKSYLSDAWLLILAILLGDVGIVLVGTLLSALSVSTKARDLMLPLLFIPVISPLFMAVVKLSSFVFASVNDPESTRVWLQFLVVYDTIFFVLPFLVFDFVVED